MDIIELAMAHLQNVHNKIEELQVTKKTLEGEIDKLKAYASQGLEIIQKEKIKEFDQK